MKKQRILIIDDEPNTTRVTKLFLEKLGTFEVREENHSASALASARAFQPDLILLDLGMPGMDGGDVAQQLESDPLLAKVPIVFFTGQIPEAEVGRHGGAWGGMRFVAKPMSAKALVHTVMQVLAEPSGAIGMS